jgi:hypothetical protein
MVKNIPSDSLAGDYGALFIKAKSNCIRNYLPCNRLSLLMKRVDFIT